MTAEHTLSRLRSREYVRPRLAVSGLHTLWQARGSKDTYALARDRVREMESVSAPSFEAPRKEAMQDIIDRFSKRTAELR